MLRAEPDRLRPLPAATSRHRHHASVDLIVLEATDSYWIALAVTPEAGDAVAVLNPAQLHCGAAKAGSQYRTRRRLVRRFKHVVVWNVAAAPPQLCLHMPVDLCLLLARQHVPGAA